MTAKLLLLRGLPGSGKSTYAATLTDYVNFEADTYFGTGDDYKWRGDLLGKAHEWCQNQTRQALIEGKNVVVSNTFTKLWEMQAYFDMAKELGVPVEVLEMTGNWPNIHGVSEEHIANMRKRWQKL